MWENNGEKYELASFFHNKSPVRLIDRKDDFLVCSGSDYSVGIFQISDQSELFIDMHLGEISSISIMDNNDILTSSFDGSIKMLCWS